LTECRVKGNEKQLKNYRNAQRLRPLEMRRPPMSIVCLEDNLELIVHFSPLGVRADFLRRADILMYCRGELMNCRGVMIWQNRS
jgi:hypothetical protein